MSTRLSSANAERAILSELSRVGFPPFTLVVKRPERAGVEAGGKLRADAEIELTWEGKRERFVVECKATATPLQVESAVAQLRALTRNAARPLLVAPYLSPKVLDRLASDGVSGVDLAGNGVITVPGEWFVLRTGNENPYPASAPIKNVYRGRSSLVCRALLLRRDYPSATALVARLRGEGVTQATVSKVLKALEQELIVARAPKGESAAGIRLAQPAELLDRLAANYQPPRATRILRGIPTGADSARPPAAAIAAIADREGVRCVIDSVLPYAPFPGTVEIPIYVESLTPLIDAGAVREDERFASVRIIETTDPIAYFDARRFGETWYASPLQVYLELETGTKRDREIAEVVRARVLEEAERAVEGESPVGASA